MKTADNNQKKKAIIEQEIEEKKATNRQIQDK